MSATMRGSHFEVYFTVEGAKCHCLTKNSELSMLVIFDLVHTQTVCTSDICDSEETSPDVPFIEL